MWAPFPSQESPVSAATTEGPPRSVTEAELTALLGTQPPPAALRAVASAAHLTRDGELLILGEEEALWELLPCHNSKASCRLIFSC